MLVVVRVRCVLCRMCCALSVVWWLMIVDRGVWLVVCCDLVVVCWPLCVVCCVLCDM